MKKKHYNHYKSFSFAVVDLKGEVIAIYETKRQLALGLGKSMRCVHENISRGCGFIWEGRKVKVHLIYNAKK